MYIYCKSESDNQLAVKTGTILNAWDAWSFMLADTNTFWNLKYDHHCVCPMIPIENVHWIEQWTPGKNMFLDSLTQLSC